MHHSGAHTPQHARRAPDPNREQEPPTPPHPHRTQGHDTPMHLAVYNRQTDAAKRLVHHGADLRAKTKVWIAQAPCGVRLPSQTLTISLQSKHTFRHRPHPSHPRGRLGLCQSIWTALIRLCGSRTCNHAAMAHAIPGLSSWRTTNNGTKCTPRLTQRRLVQMTTRVQVHAP